MTRLLACASRILVALLGTAWLWLIPYSTVAGEAAPETATGTERIERLKQALEGSERQDFAPVITPVELLKPETAASMQQALKAYYDYRSKGFRHRQAVFAWQLLSSKIIFVIVVFLVGIGIYFSWAQFTAGMQENQAKQTTPAETTIEATPSGIKVSSPVLGVIILVISLLFFYLYLVYVYPIEEIL